MFNSLINFVRNCVVLIYSGWFIYIGIMHFVDPSWFEPIVPQILGYPKFWVFLSGSIEIMLALILIPTYTRTVASLLFFSFLIVIYWANLNMWINDIAIGGKYLSNTEHLIRALIQISLIIIVMWIGKLNRQIFLSGFKWISKRNG